MQKSQLSEDRTRYVLVMRTQTFDEVRRLAEANEQSIADVIRLAEVKLGKAWIIANQESVDYPLALHDETASHLW